MMDNYNGNRGGNYYGNKSGYSNSTRNTSGYAGGQRTISQTAARGNGANGSSYKSRYGGAAQTDSSYSEIQGLIPDDEQEDDRSIIWKRVFLGLKIFAAVCLVAVIVGGIVVWLKYGKTIMKCKDEADKKVAASTPADFKPNGSSTFYDINGNEIEGIITASGEYYLTSDQIPELVKNTFIVSEDKNFYEHNGISYKGMLRAVFAIVQNGGKLAQGGSTITQQLTRNIYLSFEKSMERKLKEIFISLELEKMYEKDEILEFYINNIYFQNGYYGIEAAAQGYFGKSVNDLDAAQIVYLCAIPNNPTLYDPYSNPDKTEERKERLLEQLLADKKITKEVYDQSYTEVVTVDSYSSGNIAISNSLRSYVTYCATRELMRFSAFPFQYGFTKSQKAEEDKYDAEYKELYDRMNAQLCNTNYKVYTSIDLNAQENLQKSFDDTLLEYNTEVTSEGVYKFQGAGVSIDNATGNVVAIVGNRTQDGVVSSLNRAFRAYRQPGSAIKPILVYGPAFDKRDEDDCAQYTLTTTMVDEKITGMDDLNPPKNANGKYTNGPVTFQVAIEKSLNTIPWLLLKDISPKYALGYLKEMNFDRITMDDNNLSAALGGVSVGASPLEMCAAYATIANEGYYRQPTCITKIEAQDGSTVTDVNIGTKEVYDINTTKQLTQAMKGVLTTGTAKGYGVEGMDSAAKTGTTSKKVDGWICGYTPYYTTTVWVGYDDNTPCDDLSGATFPAKIWKKYMDAVNSGLAFKEFDTEVQGLKTEEKLTREEIYELYGLEGDYGDPYDENNPYFTNGAYNGKTLEPTETQEPDHPDGWVEDPFNPGQWVDPESLRTEEPEKTEEPKETEKPTQTPKPSPTPKPSKKPDGASESPNPSVTVGPGEKTNAPDNTASPSPDGDNNSNGGWPWN